MAKTQIKEIIKSHKQMIAHHQPGCRCYACQINQLATDLQTALADKEAEKVELNKDLDLHDTIVSTYKAEVAQLKVENKRLREALGQYGRHHPLCAKIQPHTGEIPCTCGLEQALAEENKG